MLLLRNHASAIRADASSFPIPLPPHEPLISELTSCRMGLHVQEIFTKVAVPITRMPLQVDLGDYCSDGVSHIVLSKCGASQ